jgi:multidrug efflux pump subunit AcrA (membrane-fusion protein)
VTLSAMGRRRVWWVGGVAAAIAVAVTGFVLAPDGGGGTAVAGTERVQRGTVVSTLSASGTIQALQSRSLSFSAAGTLTEVNVRPGDVVTTGAVLARIDPAAAQSDVESAQNNVDTATEDLERAEAEADGTVVAALGTTPTPSATPSATPTRTGTAPAQPTQPAQPAQPTQANQRAQGTGGLLAAQQRLNNAKLALKQAQARLDGTVITAPIAGRILTVNGAVGAQAQSNVVVIAGDGDVAVRAQFTEAEVASLAVGQTATITLPDRGEADLTGKVGQIDPAGTVSNRLVRYAAVIAFDRVPDALLYGQSATVVVTTQEVEDVLYVPTTAVSDGAVTVKVAGRTQRRAVEVGMRGDVNTEIRSGLSEGDEVLIGGG